MVSVLRERLKAWSARTSTERDAYFVEEKVSKSLFSEEVKTGVTEVSCIRGVGVQGMRHLTLSPTPYPLPPLTPTPNPLPPPLTPNPLPPTPYPLPPTPLPLLSAPTPSPLPPYPYPLPPTPNPLPPTPYPLPPNPYPLPRLYLRCGPSMTLLMKLTMAVAGCSGSSSAKSYITAMPTFSLQAGQSALSHTTLPRLDLRRALQYLPESSSDGMSSLTEMGLILAALDLHTTGPRLDQEVTHKLLQGVTSWMGGSWRVSQGWGVWCLPWSLEMPGLYQKRELSCTNFTLTRLCASPPREREPSRGPTGGAISPTDGEKVTWWVEEGGYGPLGAPALALKVDARPFGEPGRVD
ncbi:hypothetical protein JZ751_014968 [Albula glossodonta]|uniref:Uncharacterized protein n=1 Tax=Albula glossodonta TaxID=121402 RepID=A0A8T2MJ07_9TELE|nr:hypothetical protein JZ751_014968 [Albula glossodonta]